MCLNVDCLNNMSNILFGLKKFLAGFIVLVVFLLTFFDVSKIYAAESSKILDQTERFILEDITYELLPTNELKVIHFYKFYANGEIFKHGVYKKIKRVSTFLMGPYLVHNVKVLTTTLDGKLYSPIIKPGWEDITVYIGDPLVTLEPGVHTATLVYKIDKVFWAFNGYVYFWWDLYQSKPAVKTDKVRVTIKLPAGLSTKNTEIKDSTDNLDITKKTLEDSILYEFDPLKVGNQLKKEPFILTVRLKTTKGKADALGIRYTTWLGVLPEGLLFYITLLILFITLVGGTYYYLKYGKDKPLGAVMPEYSYQGKLSPAEMQFLLKGKLDFKGILGELMFLARYGLAKLEIKGGKIIGGFLSKDRLLEKQKDKKLVTHFGKDLLLRIGTRLQQILRKFNSFKIIDNPNSAQKNREIINTLKKIMQNNINAFLKDECISVMFFNYVLVALFYALLVSIIWLVVARVLVLFANNDPYLLQAIDLAVVLRLVTSIFLLTFLLTLWFFRKRLPYGALVANDFAYFVKALLISGFTLAGLSLISSQPTNLILLLPLTIFLLFVYLRALPAFTEKGREMLRYVKGLKRYIDYVEKHYLKLFTDPNKAVDVYEEFLPFAVAFGMLKKWNKWFKKYIEQLPEDKAVILQRRLDNLSSYWGINANNFTSFTNALDTVSKSISNIGRQVSTAATWGSSVGGGVSGGSGGGGGTSGGW